MATRRYHRGVVAKVLNGGVVVSEFEPQLLYYVHFWTNTVGKDKNPLISPDDGQII